MDQTITVDIGIIGAGAGGLAVAATAAQMGAKVAIVEASRMGGDCLNSGCVPSKSLLAAGHAAEMVRTSARFGVNGHEPEIRFPQVRDHVQGVIAAIAPHDSIERFTELGCTVITAPGRFLDRETIEAGSARIKARRFVIATGSRPAVPAIAGLDMVPFFTNETIFANAAGPAHLLIIGAGPIGCEMAQAHRRLGARVTLIDEHCMLGNDDAELTAVVKMQLLSEGVDIFERATVKRVDRRGNGVAVTLEHDGSRRAIEGSHLLVAAGRRPNVDDLNLEAAGIASMPDGIRVDARLRTTNRRIFAVGDVIGRAQFTHLAAYQAGIVIQNALLRLPAKADYRALPWVTYTDPELAHVGLTERQARAQHADIRVLRFPFAENDRAQTERRTSGQVKVVTTRRGDILGASLVGAHAGELLQPWILAINQRLKIKALAQMIAPYPTLGEVNTRVAGSFYTPILFGPRMRQVVRLLGLLG